LRYGGGRIGRDFSALEASGNADSWLAFASHPILPERTFAAHSRISGYLLNMELRYELRSDRIPVRAQLLGFVDAGEVTRNDAFAPGVIGTAPAWRSAEMDIGVVFRAIEDARKKNYFPRRRGCADAKFSCRTLLPMEFGTSSAIQAPPRIRCSIR
jgi:hypothetical protein